MPYSVDVSPQQMGVLRFQDQGLVNLRARWYDPRGGTFTGVDPFAGFPETPYSLHPYQYASSAPTTWTDPSGEIVVGPSCGIGYQPVYDENDRFIGCVEDPDSPEWLAFAKGWKPLPVLPGPGVIMGGATGVAGQAGGAVAGQADDILRTCAAALATAAGASLSGVNVDTEIERRDQETLRYFYHGTDLESAKNIVSSGIKPGFTQNKALGDGFYTFVHEDAAEDWSTGRIGGGGSGVVRIGMPESTFKDLKKKQLVREAPWIAYPGAPPEPGLDQVLFKPGAYLTLNLPPVTREWKGRKGVSWTDYTAAP